MVTHVALQEAQQSREECGAARQRADEALAAKLGAEKAHTTTEAELQDARLHMDWLEARVKELESQVPHMMHATCTFCTFPA